MAKDGSIEDFYPLAPLQQGMLFHSLLHPESGEYFTQLACTLRGEFDQPAFERAWQRVVDRHPGLRAGFVWEGVREAIQVVRRDVVLPIEHEDWRDKTPQQQAEALEAFFESNRRRGFVLARGPLMRLTFMRLNANEQQFVWTHHHLIMDGWCLSLILSEVFAFYDAFAKGVELELPRPRLYRDYIAWRARLETSASEAFWRRSLAGISSPTPLSFGVGSSQADRSQDKHSYGEYKQALSQRESDDVRTMAQAARVTVNTLVQGAWALVLSGYCAQDDVVFGSTVLGRSPKFEGAERVIGQFINSLPLRIHIERDATVGGWLAAIQAHNLELREHEHCALTQIQQWSEVPRGAPLFESLLIFENYAFSGELLARSGAPQIDDVRVDERQSMPIAFFVGPGPQMLLRFLYNSDRFSGAAIERLAAQVRGVLRQFAMAPQARVREVRLSTDVDVARVLNEWNPAPNEAPDETIHGHFEKLAEANPDAIALVGPAHGDADDAPLQRLSYGQLNARADRLAGHLIALGAGPEKRIGMLLERSIEMVVTMLAILKTGAAYVPVSTLQPQERIRTLLANSQLTTWVTQRQHAAELTGTGPAPVYLDDADTWKEGGPGMRAAVGGANLAYVIHTSGSTGRPKGVQITHGSLISLMKAARQRIGFGADDVWTVFHSYAFDLSVWEIWGPLLHGGRLVVVPAAATQDGAALHDLLCSERVTILNQTPSALRLLLGETLPARPAELRALMCGGEAVPCELVQRVRPWGVQVWNMYGPTEATVWVSAQLLSDPLPATSSAPLGLPLANSLMYVLDRDLHPVPIGASGELYLGGAGLARGYVNDASLTAQKFIPNPFARQAGERLYKTGDLARVQADGTLQFLGRADQQVKLHGFRIETGEIQTQLERHPNVASALVLLRQDVQREPCLVAYLIPRTNTPAGDTVAQVSAFARTVLPPYMVPAAWLLLDTFPLNANGKLDRARLPSPSPGALSRSHVAARTPAEEMLCALWGDVLKLDRVGIYDNFFELGGHSLLATRVVSRIRQTFGLALPLRSLFLAPTVAGLAAELAALDGREVEDDEVAERVQPAPAERFAPFALTDIQQAYWVGRSGAFELGNVATHVYQEIEVSDLDVPRLNQALQLLIERHDMLRAIVQPNGQQRVLAEVPPYEIQVIDLRARAPHEVQHMLLETRRTLSHQVLPADQWPLYDLRASTLDGGVIRLHISLDLLIFDAWSFRVLVPELLQLYADATTPLPPLELTFRDYVLAEQRLRTGASYRRAQAYWAAHIERLPPAPELPLVMNPAQLAQPQFSRHQMTLNHSRWSVLQQRAMQAGLTPSSVLLSAFSHVLAMWSKSARFTLNLTLFNRLPLHPQVNAIVGDFTSVTLLPVDMSGTGNFVERARRLQQQLWENLDHRQMSGVQIMRDLARQHGASGSMPVVFTSTLGLPQRRASPAPVDAAQRVKEVYAVSQTSQVWLDHQVSEQTDGLMLRWDVVEALFPEGMISAMFTAYRNLLDTLTDPENVWQTPIWPKMPVDQATQRALVNATQAPESSLLMHELFRAQAARSPDAVAVISARRSLSYRELDAIATELGHRLRALGARPNQLVAVVMEKGWEQVAAVMGILYSGAAYVPIDAGQPPDRLRLLLAHAEATIVLTQSAVTAHLDWPEGVAVLEVDTLALTSRPPLNSPQDSRDLAYVIYTSGSTGVPKGVMIDHRGAVNTLIDINARYAVGAGDRVLALSSLSFDLSVYDIFGLLAVGGALVLPHPGSLRDPANWIDLVASSGVTLWNSVPALMEMYAEYVSGSGGRIAPSLRLVMMSGDWIPLTLPALIRRLSNGVALHSLGGATEASIWSIVYPIGEIDPSWKSIPYGRPMRNQSFQVLDEQLRPCPVYVPGQLYIGGIGVALGYWHDPEKSAQRFVVWPATGERLYWTGDLGRYLPGGDIEFLGREDFQVKIQGYRIELGEIEAALLQHPQVQSAVVIATSPSGRVGERRQLAAYVVPKPDGGRGDESAFDAAEAAARQRESAYLRDYAHVFAQIPAVRATTGRMVSAYIQQAMCELDLFARPDERHTLDALISRAAILPRYVHLFGEWLAVLVEDGLLKREGDVFLNAMPLPVHKVDALLVAARTAAGGDVEQHRMLDYMDLRSRRLADIARGQVDALAVLYPEGAIDTAELVYADNSEARFYNEIAADAVMALARAHDPGRVLRVLEVGAGVGGTSATLLPRLAGLRVRYTFTDVSAFFTQQARKKFAAYEFVEYRHYDIDKTAAEQGFEPHSFDLVVAANVMHNARHIHRSMRQLSQLLAANGNLLLLEVTKSSRDVLLGARLLEKSHQFEDERATNQDPVLTVAQWQDVLDRAGFARMATVPTEGSAAAALGQRVLLARVAGGVDVDALRGFLRTKLPEYMVPPHILALEALPLSANGKVDRKALPAVIQQQPEVSRSYSAPSTDAERVLAGVLARVLGLERVSVADNFFELGGDSILGIQYSAQASHEGVLITPRQIFEHQSIRELAAVSGQGVNPAARRARAHQEFALWQALARQADSQLPAWPACAPQVFVDRLDTASSNLLREHIPANMQLWPDEVLAIALARVMQGSRTGAVVPLIIHTQRPVDPAGRSGQQTQQRTFPVWLSSSSGPLAWPELQRLKEQLRGVPAQGENFAELRADLDAGLQTQWDQLARGRLALVYDLADPVEGADVCVYARSKQDGLEITLRACAGTPSELAQLAGRFISQLRTLIAFCADQDATLLTPADFPELKLSQQGLDDLLENLE